MEIKGIKNGNFDRPLGLGEHNLLRFYTKLAENINEIRNPTYKGPRISLPAMRELYVKRLEEKYKIDLHTVPEDDYMNPILAAIEGELLKIVFLYHGNFEALEGIRILDLGCGSIDRNRHEDKNSPNSRRYEPWLCRALLELGAQPVGLDLGNLHGEYFEHYSAIDLTKTGALGFLPSQSFDMIHMSLVTASPSFIVAKNGPLSIELREQIGRVLKEAGKLTGADFELNYNYPSLTKKKI